MDFASECLAFFRRSSNWVAVYLVGEMMNQMRTTLEERNLWSKHAAYKNFICPCRVCWCIVFSIKHCSQSRGRSAMIA